VDHGEAASQVEEEGTNALEVGPEAHAAEAPQDQAAEDLVDFPLRYSRTNIHFSTLCRL